MIAEDLRKPFRVKSRLNSTWSTITAAEMWPACQASIMEFCYWMGFNPTRQQKVLLDAVQRGDLRIACKSGQGPGKSCVSVIIAFWWQIQDRDVRTCVTAPSMRQVKSVWLSEARERLKPAHPIIKKLITVTQSMVYFGGMFHGKPIHPNWRIEPFTASGPEAFQGQHNKRLNFIIEEASGVAAPIIETIKGTVTNYKNVYNPDAEEGCILQIGNPNNPEGPFFDCFFGDRGMWTCVTFNAEESAIVNPTNIARLAQEFGRDSDVYRVRVLGEFPRVAATGIIDPISLEECTRTDVSYAVRCGQAVRQFGLDYARHGGDETVIYRRIGNAVFKVGVWGRQRDFEPRDAIVQAFRRQEELRWADDKCIYVMDAGGIGQGLIHLFQDAGKDYFEFYNNSRAYNTGKYLNRISEAWFEAGQLIRENKILVPDDATLMRQLTSRHYEIDEVTGKLKVESKKVYCKRTGFSSPDRADAFVLCLYQHAWDNTRIFNKSDKSG